MKSTLRLAPHSVLPGVNVVEVWWGNVLVATVYCAEGPGVKIISKYPWEISHPGELTTEVRFRADYAPGMEP